MSIPNPDTSNSVAIEDKALDKESLIEFLGEDDGKEQSETIELEKPRKESKKGGEEEKKTTEETDGEEKELSLEEELESELEEPKTDEELDFVAPPSRKEILTKYPTLFKEFPHIEKAIYREQKYAELLPTIKDAEAAVEKSSLLDQYEKDITNGSTESMLSAVRDNDKEAFAKVVDNYLPTLFKVDQASYYHTIGNVIKHTILSMVKKSQADSDEDLGNAAGILNKFIFGTDTYSHPTKLSSESTSDNDETKKKVDEISQREQAFLERQFTTARDTLGTKVDNMVKNTVDKVIDPNDTMTEYVKSKATRDVLDSLEEAIKSDTRFRVVFDKLWERAFETNFNSESMDRIQKAYLSKARTLLPQLIQKSRREALRGLGRRNDTDDTKDRKGHLPVGKTRSSTTLTGGNAKGDKTKITVPKGMSTLDYLNSDD